MKLPLVITSVFLGSSVLTLNTTPSVNTADGKFTSLKRKSATSTKRNLQPVGSVYIVVDKSDYELNVYDDKGWYATYPVVFGNNSLADKKMEGDRNTPEGSFRIVSKRVHEKWDRFIGIDYPTKESYEKFQMRKKRGEIPNSARIGGAIGIHGTWPNDDYIIDRYKNWTQGCVSMKNVDVEDLYRYVKVGTRVIIRK